MEDLDGGEQDASEQDQSSDNDVSSDDDAPAKSNGKANSKTLVAASTSNHAETDLKREYHGILDIRMTEIKGVFENGMSENIHH